MKHLKTLLLLLALTIAQVTKADEVGFRFDSAIPVSNNSFLQFPAGDPTGHDLNYEGKMIQVFYDKNFTKNFYLEAAGGYRSPHDIDTFSSLAFELSPGLRVNWGPLVVKLSEGVSYMPQDSFDPVTWQGYNTFNLVTHLTLGLQDPKTGVGIYLDRSHFSNGKNENNPSLNYTGFQIGISF
jgi:hypothetical protein